MRDAFGLLTALPLSWDPDDAGTGWPWTPLVGVILGVAWLVFHQTFLRVGGPFVAAAGTLLLHQALTGARPLRGMAGVVARIVEDPEANRGRALPGAAGAGTAVVTLVLLVMSAFLIMLDVAPAVLVLIPLTGRVSQVLLLGDGDVALGIPAPTTGQRGVVLVGAVAALGVPPLLATLVRPVRLDVTTAEYLLIGIGSVVVSLLVTMGARAWLRARLGPLDADSWHALGAVADLTALAVVANGVT